MECEMITAREAKRRMMKVRYDKEAKRQELKASPIFTIIGRMIAEEAAIGGDYISINVADEDETKPMSKLLFEDYGYEVGYADDYMEVTWRNAK